MTELPKSSTAWTAATRVVPVRVQPSYSVAIGSGVLKHLPSLVQQVGASNLVVVTDTRVEEFYGRALNDLEWERPVPRHVVPEGESSKSFGVLEGLLDFLTEQDLDRDSVLVAFGGGVVGDLTGLAAALFMRGIKLVQVPTTLLAMVDSSVGGKTAVNLARGKNLAGCFHQPAAVLADTDLLATLSPAELRSGLGEVIKTALVGDPELLDFLQQESSAVLARKADVLAELVARCVTVKSTVVTADERESGRRKTLNLGHTFAHAIELVAGFGTIPHGVAVAVGLVLAVQAAQQAGLLRDPQLPGALQACLSAVELPTTLDSLRLDSGLDLPASELMRGLRHDKKGRAGTPALVLPRAAGDLLIDQELGEECLGSLLG